MKKSWWAGRMLAGLGLAMVGLTGCQTWHPGTGQTLPSPRYLEHPPQYLAPSPPFPLSRELASQERAAAAVPDAAIPGGVPLPPGLPAPQGGPGGGPVPLPPPPP
ncbi:MAG: hypothetical protein ACKO23_02785 [Gemmataceae bacterium]